jgi:hypothetical protein
MKKSTRNKYVIPLLLLIVACVFSTILWLKSKETFLDMKDLMAGEAVAFYNQCGYKGNVIYRQEGTYEGIRAIDMASIKIPPGWLVTISTKGYMVKFNRDNSSVEYNEDVFCLSGEISFYNPHTFYYTTDLTAISGLTLIIKRIPIPKPQLPDTRPTFYTLKNFKGESLKLDSGWYDKNRIELPPSSISSIRIPDGRTVKGFERPSFEGTSISFSKDVSDLSSYRHSLIRKATWDNRIQSLVVS